MPVQVTEKQKKNLGNGGERMNSAVSFWIITIMFGYVPLFSAGVVEHS